MHNLTNATHSNSNCNISNRTTILKFLLVGLIVSVAVMLPFSARAQTIISVAGDGTYSTPDITIQSGDEVVWEFPDRRRSIVRLVGSEATSPTCEDFDSYHEGDVNEFTGPMPLAASGIFALGPKDASLILLCSNIL